MSQFVRLLGAMAPACLAAAAFAQTAPPVAVEPAVPAAPAVAPPAPPSRLGTYFVGAIGRADYDYACYFLVACDNARATSGKLGIGYRSGVFGVEGWWSDFGKGATVDGSVRLRAIGVNAVWTARFGESLEGMLRAGMADVRYTHTGGGVTRSESKFQPTFGLGLGLVITPTLSAEFGWDITRGDADSESTVFVNAVSLGLRVRF
jgi:hypothetical protein